jgi:hypothetical protein
MPNPESVSDLFLRPNPRASCEAHPRPPFGVGPGGSGCRRGESARSRFSRRRASGYRQVVDVTRTAGFARRDSSIPTGSNSRLAGISATGGSGGRENRDSREEHVQLAAVGRGDGRRHGGLASTGRSGQQHRCAGVAGFFRPLDETLDVPNDSALANKLVKSRCWSSHLPAYPEFGLESSADAPTSPMGFGPPPSLRSMATVLRLAKRRPAPPVDSGAKSASVPGPRVGDVNSRG